MMDLVLYSEQGRTVLHTFKDDVVSGEQLLDQLRTCEPWDSYSCDAITDLRVRDSKFTAWRGIRLEPQRELVSPSDLMAIERDMLSLLQDARQLVYEQTGRNESLYEVIVYMDAVINSIEPENST